MAKEQRQERDGLILRLFLLGQRYRSIGIHLKVGLSPQGVGNVIHRGLAATAPQRDIFGEQAGAVYLIRLESLLRAAMPRALAGDMDAWEGCRRLLEQGARYFGLTASHG
jgi:hypothetical protein